MIQFFKDLLNRVQDVDVKPTKKQCRHDFREVKSFEQRYVSDSGEVTQRQHCARGYECKYCGARKIEKTKDYEKYYDINPHNWQDILNWQNEVHQSAEVLELVKK